MGCRIPREFPKVWPYDPAYRNHISMALALRDGPTTAWHALQLLSKLLMLIGLVALIIPPFGLSLLLGIVLWFTTLPFVNYYNKRQNRDFQKVMDDAAKQVATEKGHLLAKARREVMLDNDDDRANMIVLSQHSRRHYTPNWSWVRAKLLARDQHCCCLCGQRVQLADSVAHHINAFSEGGPSDFGDLVTICVECHSVIHPWLDPRLNFFWIRRERGQVYCWKCKRRLDTTTADVLICSDCGWLHHVDDGACGCSYPYRQDG